MTPPAVYRTAALLAVVVVTLGSKSYKAGERAEKIGNYDEAVTQYTRALTEKPDDATIRRALERAKLRAASVHALRASQLYARGAVTQALDEMRVAVALNPTDTLLQEQVARLERVVREQGEAAALASISRPKRAKGRSPG